MHKGGIGRNAGSNVSPREQLLPVYLECIAVQTGVQSDVQSTSKHHACQKKEPYDYSVDRHCGNPAADRRPGLGRGHSYAAGYPCAGQYGDVGLAADAVAHNYFVPYKIIRSFAAITMKHAYWEMRFEGFVEKDTWKRAHAVCRADQRGNDMLLRNVLTTTLFSFGTNKRIFNSIMVMARMEKLQRIMQTLSSKSRYQLSEADRDEYMQLSIEAIFDFLQNPEDSKYLKVDPTGEKALAAADALRRSLRLRYKSGFMSKEEGFEEVEAVRSTLRKSLHRPELLKKLHV